MTSPLTPPDCDLQDIPYMPMFVQKVLNSSFNAMADDTAWRAGVTLWLKSWQQVPSASLPDDDEQFIAMSGIKLSIDAWRKIKHKAFRGWILCDDGRLYHPVIAGAANRVWAVKLSTRARYDKHAKMESGEWAIMRLAVFERDNFTCQYCGARGVRLECDHVIPVAQGGETIPENLTTACRGCNRRKGARTPEQWRMAA